MKRQWLLLIVVLALAGCASLGARQWVSRGFDSACPASPNFAAAAGANTLSLDSLDWSPFGASEHGWRLYAPKIAHEIGTLCAPETTAFAARLARWQAEHGLPAEGWITPAAFAVMKDGWQAQRPFLALRARGVCPDPPDEAALAIAAPEESFGGKTIQIRRDALRAYERMRAAALRDLPASTPDSQRLGVFSAYRSPAYDDARCLRDQNCQGVVRAQCSAHRTGLALDLAVGAAPGYTVDASDGPNRLFQSQTSAYRWLLANARRFGFVNYPFEPWHWEWVGDEQ